MILNNGFFDFKYYRFFILHEKLLFFLVVFELMKIILNMISIVNVIQF